MTCLFLSVVGGARADELTIAPSADATLYEEGDSFANGQGDYLFSGSTKNGKRRRALLAFDIARALPAGTTITAVSLRLYVSRTQTGQAQLALHRVNAAWSEGGSAPLGQEGAGSPAATGDATWSQRSWNTSAWLKAGGDFDPVAHAGTSVSQAAASYTLTSAAMAEDVQDWLDDPAHNYGWILLNETPGENGAKRFDSRSAAEATRPTLVVTYEPPTNPVGACCDEAGSCGLRLDATSCAGSFLGTGTRCDPNPCMQPTGACCAHNASATCSEVTETDCSAANGMWHGNMNMGCDPNPCPVVLTPFVDALPLPAAAVPTAESPDAVAYRLSAVQLKQKLHRDLPATTVWGYSDGTFAGYPGPSIEAEVGTKVKVTWVNDLRDEQGNLRTSHALPVDTCLHGAENDAPRTVVHLHGGHVPSAFDGQPEQTLLPGEEATYEYPNQQQAATLWYHDHALGITRLNVYMGLAGFYLLRDPAAEADLALPSGAYDIPLVIQDRSFSADGSLRYPAQWEEHFFGDSILVNGKVWPYLDVARGKYRFRVLNGSGSRTYTLSLSNADPMIVIGGDGGLLPEPVVLYELTLAPGERADVVLDFSKQLPNTAITLQNSAKTPYPGGGMDHPAPNVMRFMVTNQAGFTEPLPTKLRARPKLPEDTAQISRDFSLAKSPDVCGGGAWRINGKMWHEITERPQLGTSEIWRFINRSGVMHPMHMHLVMFQVLDRQSFRLEGTEVVPTSEVRPANAQESGWKDTVQVGPFELVRVIARFEDYAGRFAYHCHVLEHEDQEMMRQFETVSAPETMRDAGMEELDAASEPARDAGAMDAGEADASEAAAPKPGGCGCSTLPAQGRLSAWCAIAGLSLLSWRRRRRRP